MQLKCNINSFPVVIKCHKILIVLRIFSFLNHMGEKIKNPKPQQCDVCIVIKIIISGSFVLFHCSVPDLYFEKDQSMDCKGDDRLYPIPTEINQRSLIGLPFGKWSQWEQK